MRAIVFAVLSLITVGTTPAMADFEDDQAHKDYVEGYLAKCPENMVHCVWFLGRYKVAMVMRIDLKLASVFTGRMTPRAAQNTGTQRMTHSQLMSLKSILSAMPSGVTTASDLSCVHIAYREGDKVETRRYLLSKLPPEIQRIYDLAGGDIDTTNGEQAGTGQPATRSQSESEGGDKPQPKSEGRSR